MTADRQGEPGIFSFEPRAILREGLAVFRERFVARRIRVSSEIPARLPAAIPFPTERMAALLGRLLECAAAQEGLRSLGLRTDWRPGEAGRGVFHFDGVLEGELAGGVEETLRQAMAEAAQPLAATATVEREGPGRVRCGVVFPPADLLELDRPAEGARTVRPGRDPSFALRHPFRVLVVDDSDIGRKLTCRLLRNLGYEPDRAGSGAEAIRLSAEKPYELIFMDLRMPDLDGRETMLEIVKLGNGPAPRVVALTAEISEVERRRCLEVGMAEFLTKPCRGDDLAEAIHNLSMAGGRRARPVPSPVAATVAVRWETAEILNQGTARTLKGMPGSTQATLLGELYESLKRDTPENFRLASEGLQRGDMEQLRHQIHQMTGNFEVLGAGRMALFCRSCTDAAHREAFGELKFLFERFDSNYTALRGELEAMIRDGG